MDIPDVSLAEALRGRIKEAWRLVRRPEGAGLSWHDEPGEDLVGKYFGGRSVEQVDPGDPAISEEHPFLYMSREGVWYYIQAYLLYCLDIERHARGPVPSCCDTPCIHLIATLCGKHGIKDAPSYTEEQIRCLIEFLQFLRSFPDFYGCGNRDEMRYLDRGIKEWSRKLRGG